MPCAAQSIRERASPAQLAYLEDRVRIDAGQPQLYGTQFAVTDGEFGPCPLVRLHPHSAYRVARAPVNG